MVAIYGIPTISSSVSGTEIFPFLSVKHKDYNEELLMIKNY